MNTFRTKKGTEIPIASIKGKDYLNVCWRIVWFREDHPNWCIETEFLERLPDKTVAKATIRNENGMIISIAHKSQRPKPGMAEHLESAETGAIGRALANCGYGTQFTDTDDDDGEVDTDESDLIADAPVEKPSKRDDLLNELYALSGKYKIIDKIKDYMSSKFNKTEGKSLTENELKDILNWVQTECVHAIVHI